MTPDSLVAGQARFAGSVLAAVEYDPVEAFTPCLLKPYAACRKVALFSNGLSHVMAPRQVPHAYPRATLSRLRRQKHVSVCALAALPSWWHLLLM